MGVPGFVLALLASRLREPRRRPPAPLGATVRGWAERGVRRAMSYGAPLVVLGLAGAVASAVVNRFERVPAAVPTLKPDQGKFRVHFFTPEQTEENMPKWKSVSDELFR